MGISLGSGNAYVRNSRFENSSRYDINPGWVYWLFSSIHRVVSVGSDSFLRGGGNGLSMMDVHVDSWLGNTTQTFCVVGEELTTHCPPGSGQVESRGSAMALRGQVQAHDITFTNPRCSGQCSGFSVCPGCSARLPLILSNSTIDKAANLTHWLGPEHPRSAKRLLSDLSDAANPLHSPGKCPATGIDRDSNFYKSTWPIPKKVFEIAAFLPDVNGSARAWVPVVNRTCPWMAVGPHSWRCLPPAAEVTAAVQSCINAAAAAGDSSVAYFPTGVYHLTETIVISGRNFFIAGTGYETQFQWAGPVVNGTAGAPKNATAERLATMWRVHSGTQVTIEMLQLWPARSVDDVVRLRVQGSTGTDHIASPLVDGTAVSAACTDGRVLSRVLALLLCSARSNAVRGCPTVTIHGLELNGYDEMARSWTSGVLLQNLAQCDVVDVIHMDGDIHSVGNAGTVLVGFHTAGKVVLEPPPAPATQPASGFFGEMARFTCCTKNFTTHIIGPQLYAVGAFYQESGNNEFRFTGAPAGGTSAALGKPGTRGTVAINGIKHYTMVAEPRDLFESWDGDAFFTAGSWSTQTENCPGAATGGAPSNQCNMTVVINGSGTTNVAYVSVQPWDYPMSYDVSGKHTVTQFRSL